MKAPCCAKQANLGGLRFLLQDRLETVGGLGGRGIKRKDSASEASFLGILKTILCLSPQDTLTKEPARECGVVTCSTSRLGQ